MTPAQLGVLIDQHNVAHTPSDGKHARTAPQRTNDPADLLAIAAMRRNG